MNYTTIEQSKHLLELGLNPETADMWWSRCCIIDFNDGKGLSIGYSVQPVNLSESKNTDKDIPCWSVGALLGCLRSYNDCNKLDIFSNRSQKWQITISYYDFVWKEHEEININLLEASYDTVVWLLENGYIETEKK